MPVETVAEPSGDALPVILNRKGISCPCEACKLLRAEGHKLRSSVVHRYDFTPTAWQLRELRNDPFSYFLGVELETDNYNSRTVSSTGTLSRRAGVEYSDVAYAIAADMRRPKTFWIPKADGSVTGPEFASHPATLTYWRAKQRQVAEMFQMLIHAGYRSYDNDKCGMHVNISRTAIDGRDHMYRFLTLLHVSKAWSLRMSQRTLNSADHWASFSRAESAEARVQMVDGIFGSAGYATEKYSVLNAPQNQPRFEFRLPRGTLRIDRFFKNLEWTVAMIEFTRTATLIDSRPTEFMKWVEKHSLQYPNLAAYQRERSVVLNRAATGVVDPSIAA